MKAIITLKNVSIFEEEREKETFKLIDEIKDIKKYKEEKNTNFDFIGSGIYQFVNDKVIYNCRIIIYKDIRTKEVILSGNFANTDKTRTFITNRIVKRYIDEF